MDAVRMIIVLFSLAGAADWLFGSRLGIGREFERAFSLFAPMALSMLGMLVLAPAIGAWLSPAFEGFYRVFRLDPSIIPASLLANDMGGMLLSQSVCRSAAVGDFNAFVVSSMMGCTVSFTVPLSLGLVPREKHRELFLGLLCGIVTIPAGSFVAGLLCGLTPGAVLLDLLPLLLLSAVIGAALLCLTELCIRCFAAFGFFMRFLGIAGLACAVFTFLTGLTPDPRLDSLENGVLVCANACVTLSGALPFMFVMEKLLKKPLGKLGARLGIGDLAALALLGNLVTNVSVFGVMGKMDRKGTVLTAAFSVSAAFVFGSHLAFTMAFDPGYVLPMVAGKLLSGLCGVALALLICKLSPEGA